MQMQYTCLLNLIESDNDARHYYDLLPAFIRDELCARSKSVNTFEDLQGYAENLMSHND